MITPLAPVVIVTDADIDALIEEVYAKPGLGVEDSAGLLDMVDYDEEAEDYEDYMADIEFWRRGC